MKNKQGILMITGNFVYLVSQWLMTVLVVRLSSDYHDAGVLGLAMTITAVFYIIACYGMRSFQVSDIQKEYRDQEYILSRVFTTAIAVVGCAIYVWVEGYSDRGTFGPIMIYMLYKGLEAASDVTYGIFQNEDRFDYICISMCTKGILSLILFAVLLSTGMTLNTALMAMVAVALATFLFLDLRWCHKFVTPMLIWDKRTLCQTMHLLRSSALMVVLLIAQPLLMSIPRLFFEKNFSTELLGIYSSVSSPTVIISTFVSCAMMPYLPMFAQYYQERKKKNLYRLTFGAMTFALGFGLICLVGGAILGEWGLTFLYGEGLRDYVDILLLVIVVTTLSAVTMCLNSLFIALRKLMLLSATLLFGCGICYVITPYFVTRFAMRGITYALIISQGIQILLGTLLGIYFISQISNEHKGKKSESNN